MLVGNHKNGTDVEKGSFNLQRIYLFLNIQFEPTIFFSVKPLTLFEITI
jgi:hypothetical protein